MLIIRKEKIIDFYVLNYLYEIHMIEERIRLFEKKYQISFRNFEIQLFKEEENFEKWDDYMEWKAYLKSFHHLKIKKEQIKNGNYQIS